MAEKRRIERLIIVTRRTEFEELVARFNTAAQAEFYLKSAGDDFGPIRARHERYQAAVLTLRRSLPPALKHITIDRSLVPQFDFQADAVMAIGQDGLVSNTAKYLEGQPLFGVNPDPNEYEGVLLPWTPANASTGLAAYTNGRAKIEHVTLAEAATQDGRRLVAFNDLFIGPVNHGSARYDIRFDGTSEFQSSSGIIVSTGAGSTGWMSSVHFGAIGIAQGLCGTTLKSPTKFGQFPRNAERLVFSVREPWPSRTTGVSLIHGSIVPGQVLTLVSHMPTGGTIFSDGLEWDNLDFNAGTTVTVSISSRKTVLVLP